MQLDSNGSVVVKYVYDAWGNCKTTVVDENAAAIAELNPFRYRSYYFDVETNFYFLKTRYYDPEIARFITIDDIAYLSFVIVNGLNLYAYCVDNPIMSTDYMGTWAIKDFIDNVVEKVKTFVDNVTTIAENVRRDIDNFDSNNTSEDTVLSANYFSSYEGKLVIILPIGKDAFSFGIMFIGNDVDLRSDSIDTIKHEYGHTVQFDNMGIIKYTFDVAIPSVTAYNLQKKGDLPFYYFSAPWEAEADIHGGVTRDGSKIRSWTPNDGYYNIFDLINSLS